MVKNCLCLTFKILEVFKLSHFSFYFVEKKHVLCTTPNQSIKINSFQNYYNNTIKNEILVDLAIVLSIVAIMVLKCLVTVPSLSLHCLLPSCQLFWCAGPLNHLIILKF